MGGIKRILLWVKPYRNKMILGYALMVLSMLIRVIMPYITKLVVDDVIPERNLQLLYQLCALIIGLTVVRGAMIYMRGILFEDVSQSVVYDLRTGLYQHMQELSSSFYDQHHIGEIMSRMTGDVEGIRNLVINGFLSIVENAMMFIFSLIGMGLMSPPLMLSMLVLSPIIALAAWKLNKVIHPAFKDIREQNAVLNTRTQENIAGVRVVKAFAHEEYEKQTFGVENNKVLEMNLRVTRIWSKYFPLMDMIAGMATPLLILVGGLLALGGHIGVGALVGATGYVWMLVAPMRQVSSFVNLVTNGLVSSEKIVYYLDLGSRIRTPQNPVEPAIREGRVDFDHVTFRYGDTETLIDVDLHVEPGQTVAIMGATGTGKSTVIALLGRYYDVSCGAVRVDGVDVRAQSLAGLRSQIGVVMQETFLFSESIENNIRFGKPEASHEEVERAAHIACADEFIHQMKDGYDTIVGERGLGLSGGQKQRVALARALLYDPNILVLDDATSAIDMETEAVIQARLREANKRRTTLIIAHRISSVRHADLIVVLRNKTIAERGTHEELLARRGLYYQMFLDQTRDFDTAQGKAGE